MQCCSSNARVELTSNNCVTQCSLHTYDSSLPGRSPYNELKQVTDKLINVQRQLFLK
ncbi:hypothetical protein Mapa_017022 [Marchantia paleacea]|nr:hypothetical protein Mapa_017022 [Marchantia paleacea]